MNNQTATAPVITPSKDTSFADLAARLTRAVDLETVGRSVTLYGLVLVLLWIGGMKFTAYESEGIKPFVANSPLMSFVYQLMSVRGFSALLGVVEIAVGLMIAMQPFKPWISAAGGVLATGMFLTTLSFLLSTPGAFEPSEGGFPALSVPGQFLLKDVVLLGASLWTVGISLKAAARTR